MSDQKCDAVDLAKEETAVPDLAVKKRVIIRFRQFSGTALEGNEAAFFVFDVNVMVGADIVQIFTNGHRSVLLS